MKIFIIGNSVLSFTSGTPMRGLIKNLIEQRSNDFFYIYITYFYEIEETIKEYLNSLENYQNVEITLKKEHSFIYNIKTLLSIKTKKHSNDFDIYLSPGWPHYFHPKNSPSLSVVADLSSVNMPDKSSLKWHGNKIFKNNLKWALKSNNKILSISNYTKDELKQYSPKNSNKFDTLYNGIEDFWFDDKYKKNALVENLEKENYWIWYGYISNRKNIKFLLEAYLSLVNNGEILPKIVFIGSIASDQQEVKSIIYNNKEYFPLIDFQDNYILKSLVKNSKGLLFPSLYEGFGLPVIEAYSQGLPVLYSNVTSLPEIGNNLGVMVNPYEIDSIKEGLLVMEKEENFNLKLINARKEWADNFRYKKSASKLSSLIDEMVKTK